MSKTKNKHLSKDQEGASPHCILSTRRQCHSARSNPSIRGLNGARVYTHTSHTQQQHCRAAHQQLGGTSRREGLPPSLVRAALATTVASLSFLLLRYRLAGRTTNLVWDRSMRPTDCLFWTDGLDFTETWGPRRDICIGTGKCFCDIGQAEGATCRASLMMNGLDPLFLEYFYFGYLPKYLGAVMMLVTSRLEDACEMS